jgi:cytochrome P450
MHHDDAGRFHNGNHFNPERYLNEGELHKDGSLVDGHWTFGFGRRACPARHLAANSVWIALARLIWAYDVTPAPGAGSRSYNVEDVDWIVGVNMYVFSCLIRSVRDLM